jgi:dTDP-glucose 4,6-dehydratase
MQTVLITGGAGFIGSNFIPYFLGNNKEFKVVNLDLLTYAGNLYNLTEVENDSRYTFVKGDICDRSFIERLFRKYKFTGVIHFAAESHVDNSWMDATNKYQKEFKNARFHHISTDEVYGTLGETGLFTEETSYAPNSPYSASKASSDFMVRSYFHTYGLNVVTTNCSNNYGPKQHDEKLIPTIIRKAISGENIPIYGDGKNIRDWLYVLDHCKGIELAYQNGKAGETYNIGGENEHNNLYIATTICAILDEILPKKASYKKQITFVDDRLGHDFRYAIDASKIESELNWRLGESFNEGIKKTIKWYLKKYK